jgi:hypothetical protein
MDFQIFATKFAAEISMVHGIFVLLTQLIEVDKSQIAWTLHYFDRSFLIASTTSGFIPRRTSSGLSP